MTVKAPKGLGRGLEALLGDLGEAQENVLEIDINSIDPNREQARKLFDPQKLQELAESIRMYGIVIPLLVIKKGGRYRIVAGERRYRAARMAGLSTVPAIVKELDDEKLLEVSLIENIQRDDLNPVEEAAAIKFLMQQHDLTQEEVSEKLGKSRPAVANSLRLLTLPEEVLQLLRTGGISAGHARALVSLGDKEEQIRLCKLIESTGMSVRELENLFKKKSNSEKKKPKNTEQTEFYDVEEGLREALQTKVKLMGSLNTGKIIIEYFTAEELQRLYSQLTAE